MDSSYIKVFFFGLVLMLAGAMQDATAQICSSIATQSNNPWIYTPGDAPEKFIWNLTQDKAGNVTGTFTESSWFPNTVNTCNTSTATVSGTYNQGAFTFSLGNGWSCNGGGFIAQPGMQMSGNVSGDCSKMDASDFSFLEGVGNATVRKDLGPFGIFTHAPGAGVPTGETSKGGFAGWNDALKWNNNNWPTVADFNVTLLPASSTQWDTGTVQETFPQASVNKCWRASDGPQKTGIAPDPVAIVDGKYQDLVGPNPGGLKTGVTYWRQNNRTPCRITSQQVMLFAGPTGGQNKYKTNTLIMDIGTQTVTITRDDSGGQNRLWGPPPPSTADFVPIIDTVVLSLILPFKQ